jgi:hypothetical protein
MPQGLSPRENAAWARQIRGHNARIADQTNSRAAVHNGLATIVSNPQARAGTTSNKRARCVGFAFRRPGHARPSDILYKHVHWRTLGLWCR